MHLDAQYIYGKQWQSALLTVIIEQKFKVASWLPNQEMPVAFDWPCYRLSQSQQRAFASNNGKAQR